MARRDEPSELRLTANGLSHHVLAWDGGGPLTVLCLHGFLDLAWGFAPLAPLLARAGHRVIAPDFRGHGETDRVGAGGYYHFFDLVLDVAELIEQLEPERLAIVGHSMGGAVAAFYAGTFPEKVDRLALLEGLAVEETPTATLPARTRTWIEGVRAARKRTPRTYPTREAAAARLRTVDPRCPAPTARLLAEKGTVEVPGGFSFRHDPLHLTRGPYPFRFASSRVFWERVTCPTLLVEGRETELPTPDRELRYACFQSARRCTIPDAGHMMIRHQPARLAQELLEFLT